MPIASKKRSPDGLTDKQRVFCSEYLINGFNASKAAIKAGYSPKAAKEKGSQILTIINVQSYLNARINSVLEGQREQLKAEIIAEARKLAMADVGSLVQYDQDGVAVFPSDKVDTSIIQSVEIKQEIVKAGDQISVSNKDIKFKLHSKVEAMKILSQYIGLSEPVNVNVDLSGLIDYKQQILDKINGNNKPSDAD